MESDLNTFFHYAIMLIPMIGTLAILTGICASIAINVPTEEEFEDEIEREVEETN